MIIGILGPSKLEKHNKFERSCKEISKILASKGLQIIISPDKKSLAEFFAMEFKKGGGFVIGVDYEDDTDLGYLGLNRNICDKLIHCKTWENQPKVLIKNSDILIVLGLSVGVTWEICLTKFYWASKKNKIFIIKETCKDKLPAYLMKSLPIEYISIKELDKKF